jgi:hypothetical protein
MKITDEEGKSWAVQQVQNGVSRNEVAEQLGCTYSQLARVLANARIDDLHSGRHDDPQKEASRQHLLNARQRRHDEIARESFAAKFKELMSYLSMLALLGIMAAVVLVPMFYFFIYRTYEDDLDRTVLNCRGTMETGRTKRAIVVDALIEEFPWYAPNIFRFRLSSQSWMKVWIGSRDGTYMKLKYIGDEDEYWERRIYHPEETDFAGLYSRLHNELILDIKNYETSDKGKVSFTFKGKCVTRKM